DSQCSLSRSPRRPGPGRRVRRSAAHPHLRRARYHGTRSHTDEAPAETEGGIMSDQSERIVKKLWSYCQVLRDDGLSYQDYLEQLTFLLFLKMADERAALTGEAQPIPKGHRWDDLANPKMEGVQLEQH